ncbi:unnamed protein product [Ixodes pacificus]
MQERTSPAPPPPQWSPILDCWHCMPKKGVKSLKVKLQAVKWQLVDSGSSPTTMERRRPRRRFATQTVVPICQNTVPLLCAWANNGRKALKMRRLCNLVALPKNQALTSGDVTFKMRCTLLSPRERRADPHDNAQRPRREAI